ncbi:DUF4302 domain-containing protein [Dyadobacter sp. CY323]|uniref:DUF4302 domain-containing protein n=1 Tax=Dyadobacter sp. CY323 TaxID=2907302 RepID=UPI001F2280B4|nr:DUF4302 domain-containing protein [Dyadobacter sp. CY323]MCE6992736.1 DUF4302 domain-containing protein [Dyadobacter sp. CY323]
MKNSILYVLFLTAAFFSCENSDDTVFEETADVRLNAALASYEKQLVEAPSGWNAVIYPAGGGSYGFHFKFNNQNRVVMYSDFADASAATAKESSYRLKALQTPSLIFDTYSYLHVLSDPESDVNGGDLGEGLKSDFEFSIFPDSVKTDVITLVGRKNKSRLVLTRANEAQATAYTNGSVAKSLLFNNIAKYQTYFKRITLGGVTYEITVNQQDRVIKLTWLSGTTGNTFTTEYYFGPAGLTFVKPLVNGSQTITGFTNFTWNANTVQLGFSGAGANTVVTTAIKPLAVDLAASRRWWQKPVDSGGEWRSEFGFHVNGVDDAFKVKDLVSGKDEFAFYIYQPAVDPDYDVFAPVFYIEEEEKLDLVYGHAPGRPTFVADGRVIFPEWGSLGTVPKPGPAASSAALLFDPSGFYLIQTSEDTYDMVSAKDAKAWITWE